MALRITSRGRTVIGAALVAGCLAGYAATANVERTESTTTHSTHTEAATPDWAVAPCSFDFRPGMTRTITLPAYTMTDRCVQPDGRITISDSFKVVEDFGGVK